jgi:hypothetical protein
LYLRLMVLPEIRPPFPNEFTLAQTLPGRQTFSVSSALPGVHFHPLTWAAPAELRQATTMMRAGIVNGLAPNVRTGFLMGISLPTRPQARYFPHAKRHLGYGLGMSNVYAFEERHEICNGLANL